MRTLRCLASTPIRSTSRFAWASQRALTHRNPVRHLNVHEWQGQELMRKYGVNVPKGSVAYTTKESVNVASKLESDDIVIKAQVLAGGRGKGSFTNGFKGGVHIVSKNGGEVEEVASKMLGSTLVTKQTGAEGRPCNSVYVMERLFLRKEIYLAILQDRATSGPTIIVSPEGGVDIEAVAAKTPELIFKESVDPALGPTDAALNNLVSNLDLEAEQRDMLKDQIQKLYRMFVEKDCTQVEINPLAETTDGRIVCVDAKLNFDDNAEFRQEEVFRMRDYTQEDPREVAAAKADVNYIGLDGAIGCLVNGAGLAMGTMDIIKLHGGSPANFLDVGGSATEGQVTESMRIISQDKHVKVILVNIFGGIMRCDVIAAGVVSAMRALKLEMPVVVRLEGTNLEEGQRILADSGLPIITASDLDEAAQKAVEAASKV